MNYDELESAYRQNMFASGGDRKETLLELYKELDDKGITGDSEKNLYHLAASYFDYLAVEYLASEGVKSRPDEYNNTPLHDAAASPYGNDKNNFSKMDEQIYRTAKALINAGVNPKKKNDDGSIAYVKAALSGNYPLLRAVAEADVKMDAVVGEGKNLISKICDTLYHRKNIAGEKENAYETIKILLASGVDPEDKDIFDRDAIYYAQRSEVKEIAALVSGAEDDETAVKTGGQTLTRAILNNDMEAVQALLESGANPDEVEEQERTPLMWACEYPNPELVKLLLKYKGNPNYTVGETGMTALSYLLTTSIQHIRSGSPQEIRKTYTSILRALFDAKLNADASLDAEGNTALIYVANMDYFAGLNNALAEELIEGGADVNKANLKGETPLMVFAWRGDEQEHGIAELLLDSGADPTLADKASNTALMYAAANNNKASGKKIAELILEAGYKNLERVNNAGQSAMDIAVHNQNEALVKLLITNM